MLALYREEGQVEVEREAEPGTPVGGSGKRAVHRLHLRWDMRSAYVQTRRLRRTDILYVRLVDDESVARQTFLDDLRIIDHSAKRAPS